MLLGTVYGQMNVLIHYVTVRLQERTETCTGSVLLVYVRLHLHIVWLLIRICLYLSIGCSVLIDLTEFFVRKENLLWISKRNVNGQIQCLHESEPVRLVQILWSTGDSCRSYTTAHSQCKPPQLLIHHYNNCINAQNTHSKDATICWVLGWMWTSESGAGLTRVEITKCWPLWRCNGPSGLEWEMVSEQAQWQGCDHHRAARHNII